MSDVSAVAAAISKGARIRGVVLDLRSKEARFRSLIEKSGVLRPDAAKIARIPRSAAWEDLREHVIRNLVLKKTTVGLSFNLWLFSDLAIIEPYHFGKLDDNLVHMCRFSQFIIPSTRDLEYRMLKEHFEVLWKHATPLWPDPQPGRQGDEAS